MPIEAIASTNSTATGMSVSCSGVTVSVNGIVTSGPNGMTEKATNAGTTEMHRRDDEDHLVGRLGGDVLLERQLHAVGEALQQPEGAVHVGADAVLHARDDAALPPDVEQRQQHQDHEDQHGLEQDDPDGVLAEGAEVVGPGDQTAAR